MYAIYIEVPYTSLLLTRFVQYPYKASGTTHPAFFFPYVFWGGQARHGFFSENVVREWQEQRGSM